MGDYQLRKEEERRVGTVEKVGMLFPCYAYGKSKATFSTAHCPLFQIFNITFFSALFCFHICITIFLTRFNYYAKSNVWLGKMERKKKNDEIMQVHICSSLFCNVNSSRSEVEKLLEEEDYDVETISKEDEDSLMDTVDDEDLSINHPPSGVDVQVGSEGMGVTGNQPHTPVQSGSEGILVTTDEPPTPIQDEKKEKAKGSSKTLKRRERRAKAAAAKRGETAEPKRIEPVVGREPQASSSSKPPQFPETPSTRDNTRVRRVNLSDIDPTMKVIQVDGDRAKKRERDTPTSGNPIEKKKRPTYREAAEKALVVEVTLADSSKSMTEDHSIEVQEGLKRAIDEMDGTTRLRFGGFSLRGGRMAITCHDATTKLWIEMEVGKLAEGKYTTQDSTPPKSEPKMKVSVWVREATPPQGKDICNKISRQNGGINTTGWRMTHAIQSGPGHVLFLRMTEKEAATIRPPSQLNYYLDVMVFRFHERPRQD
jgi:hypothetical protein